MSRLWIASLALAMTEPFSICAMVPISREYHKLSETMATVQGMIRKSVQRFSEKIMLNQRAKARW
jgi:hypothetical protein